MVVQWSTGNIPAAVCLFMEMYQQQRHLNSRTFISLDSNLWETGCLPVVRCSRCYVGNKVIGLKVLKKIFCMLLNDPFMLVAGGWPLITVFLRLQHGGCWTSNSSVHTMYSLFKFWNKQVLSIEVCYNGCCSRMQLIQTFSAESWARWNMIYMGMVFWIIVTWPYCLMEIHIQFRKHSSSISS